MTDYCYHCGRSQPHFGKSKPTRLPIFCPVCGNPAGEIVAPGIDAKEDCFPCVNCGQ